MAPRGCVWGLSGIKHSHGKEKVPYALIQDLFDQLEKSTYLLELDFCSDYWQFQIAEEDDPKMMCATCDGSYEFLVMPFGLTNVSATFCHLMNQLFYDILMILWLYTLMMLWCLGNPWKITFIT